MAGNNAAPLCAIHDFIAPEPCGLARGCPALALPQVRPQQNLHTYAGDDNVMGPSRVPNRFAKLMVELVTKYPTSIIKRPDLNSQQKM